MKAIPTSSATAATSASISSVLLLLELDSEAADFEVTVRTGTDGVDSVAPAGALPFWALFGAAACVTPVEAFGVAAGAELVGAGVVGAGVVEGAVAVDTPGGGANTAAPAPAGAASASSASPHRDILSAVAWMIELARMGQSEQRGYRLRGRLGSDLESLGCGWGATPEAAREAAGTEDGTREPRP
jgi:hypothetical protein